MQLHILPILPSFSLQEKSDCYQKTVKLERKGFFRDRLCKDTVTIPVPHLQNSEPCLIVQGFIDP